MSSILKALKKLESEKSQRDELSTAVASDILRSSRSRSRYPAILIFACVALIIAIAGVGYYSAIKLHTPVVSENVPGKTSSPVLKDNIAPVTPAERPSINRTLAPDLPLLSGIVYQENPASRLAIINDLPVMEGTLVEGYEVKLIYPDQVLLVRNSIEYVLVLEHE